MIQNTADLTVKHDNSCKHDRMHMGIGDQLGFKSTIVKPTKAKLPYGKVVFRKIYPNDIIHDIKDKGARS